MCGIFGIVRKNSNVNLSEVEHFTNTLSHRGPDGSGYYINDRIGLGHRRLSIIDLDSGKQPMKDTNEEYIISYNGEIYNYKELRLELNKLGCKFRTHSDTEVVLYAYKYWGVQCLTKFRGMFAFGIVDYKNETIFLARDRSGIKPLFYRQEEDYFAFGSEIKSLLNIDFKPQGESKGLSDYFQYGFIPAPYTIYKNIFKLQAAHYKFVSFDAKGLEEKNYYKAKFYRKKLVLKKKQYLKLLKKTISQSVKANLTADVPVGVFLSGGIDSSIIACYAKEHTTINDAFSIGFENSSYDETHYAQLVAEKLGISLHKEVLNEEVYNNLQEILSLFDEPFGDDSIIPTWHVAKNASSKYSVVLSGDGADELFAGYWRYKRFLKNYKPSLKELITSKSIKYPRRFFRALKKIITTKTNLENHLKAFNTKFSYSERSQLLNYPIQDSTLIYQKISKVLKNFSLLEKLQFIDFNLYLPYNICTKVDTVSMANSLEVRPVFLDNEIIDLAFKTPKDFKLTSYSNKGGKEILKKVLEPHFSNDFIYRKKQGFSSPLQDLFLIENNYYKLLKSSLQFAGIQQIINIKFVENLLERHQETKNLGYNLFTILSFTLWYQNNLNIKF